MPIRLTRKPRFIDPVILPLWALNRYNLNHAVECFNIEVNKMNPSNEKIGRYLTSMAQHNAVFNEFKPVFFN